MKLIDYDKHKENSTPRAALVSALVLALTTGFLLGLALMEGVHSRNSSDWMFPLALGFANGVLALRAALLALHNCPTSPQAQRTEASEH
jgi:hypothetical protein